MEMFKTVSGKMVKHMAKQLIVHKMVENMKDNLYIMLLKVRGFILGPMVVNILATGKTIKWKDMVNLLGKTVKHIKGIM